MDLNTYNYEVLPLSGHVNPISIDLDSLNQQIYWTDVGSKQIRTASFTGNNQRVIRQLGISTFNASLKLAFIFSKIFLIINKQGNIFNVKSNYSLLVIYILYDGHF